jgi:hypothetical protein
MGFLARISELLRIAPHLFELLRSCQGYFLEAEQGSTERNREALGRTATVLTEAKAYELPYVDFSTKRRIVGPRDFTDVRCGCIVQLSFAHEQLAAAELGG